MHSTSREYSVELSEPRPVLVVGVGNEALRDEGVGIHAVRALSEQELPAGVSVLDGGTSGFGLLGRLEGVWRLVLVDAMAMGRPAGTVVTVRPEELQSLAPAGRASLHDTGLLEVLDLAGALGLRPREVYIVGVQPAEVTWGLELSPTLQAALPRVVQAALAAALETPEGGSLARREGDPPKGDRKHMGKTKKILIIDDDPDIVEALRLTLRGNYQVFDAASGQEGLRKVKEIEPDLIILDVMMETETEGFQVSLALRSPDPASEYAAYARIPILVLTAIHQKTPLRFAPDADYLPVDDFVEKPVKPGVLLAKVKKLLGNARS